MSGDAGIAQDNREIAGFDALQNEARVGDRTEALSPVQRNAERLRRSCNVVEQPGQPEAFPVARQSEAKHRIVQCFGRKLQKSDLTRNADAHVFPIYLTGRQTGASQQRLEDNACLVHACCG